MIGKTISHYKILEKLGEGGMGVVYKAEDTKLKREVAIKFLPRRIDISQEERKRFKVEAQAAAALNHPNIATIHNIEEVGDEIFIVMEYIDGKELKDKIEKAPISIQDTVAIALQIAGGLQAAHDKGVTHRDIKSANIMFTEKGDVKIMDFGLAKVRGGAKLTLEQSTLGTAPYMSPEQARGEDVDHRSDIFSLGVLLYEMLTGQLPFKGDYEQAITYSILNEEPELGEIPGELQHVVSRSLAKDQTERYQSIDELHSDLKSSEESNTTRTKAARKVRKQGAIAFAVISSGEDGFVLTSEEAGAAAAMSSVALGGLTGLVVGSLSKTDQWQTIAIQDIVLRFVPKDKLATSRPKDRKKKIHRWSASVFSGKTHSNVGSDIESSFNNNGFENDRFGPSTSGSSSTLFALNYRLNPWLTAGLIHSQTDFGETIGWQRFGSGFSYLGTPITSSAKTSSFLLSLNLSHLNAGIGPAIYLISSHALNRGDKKNYKTTKLGAVAQVGLQVPHPNWPVFLELKFQYHMVGSVEIGPFEFEAGRQSRTFPKTKVEANHMFMGVGIGFKF